jgi:hypothetical protein
MVSMMRTVSSALTLIQMFGLEAASSDRRAGAADRQISADHQPPPAAVAVFRKVRRESDLVMRASFLKLGPRV